MGTTNPLGRLFGRNPFKSLQQHMEVVIACVEEVPGLFEALAAQDQGAVNQSKERIFALEEEADQLRNELRQHLPRGLFLPVDRRDLLEVLDMQEAIANTTQDIAGLLIERTMVIPASMSKPLVEYVEQCIQVCRGAGQVIDHLDELLEMGFRGREAAQVEDMIIGLNISEDRTDEQGIALTRLLFKLEDTMNPVSVMFWYRLIEWIGDLADHAEKVGNRLRIMLAK